MGLLKISHFYKSLIAVYTDRLSSNDKEIDDNSTSIYDKITLMNTFDFTDQFERAVNRTITDICYSSPICGDRDKLSRVEKEIVSLLFSCLRKEYPTSGMAKTNSCFYEYSKLRDIIASEKEKDSSNYDDSEHEKLYLSTLLYTIMHPSLHLRFCIFISLILMVIRVIQKLMNNVKFRKYSKDIFRIWVSRAIII